MTLRKFIGTITGSRRRRWKRVNFEHKLNNWRAQYRQAEQRVASASPEKRAQEEKHFQFAKMWAEIFCPNWRSYQPPKPNWP